MNKTIRQTQKALQQNKLVCITDDLFVPRQTIVLLGYVSRYFNVWGQKVAVLILSSGNEYFLTDANYARLRHQLKTSMLPVKLDLFIYKRARYEVRREPLYYCCGKSTPYLKIHGQSPSSVVPFWVLWLTVDEYNKLKYRKLKQ